MCVHQGQLDGTVQWWWGCDVDSLSVNFIYPSRLPGGLSAALTQTKTGLCNTHTPQLHKLSSPTTARQLETLTWPFRCTQGCPIRPGLLTSLTCTWGAILLSLHCVQDEVCSCSPSGTDQWDM